MHRFLKTAAAGLLACGLLAACMPMGGPPPGGGQPQPRQAEQPAQAPARQSTQGAPATRQEQPANTRVFIHNANGSRTPVDLERVGNDQWRGPKGETYYGVPSEEKLRPKYGLR